MNMASGQDDSFIDLQTTVTSSNRSSNNDTRSKITKRELKATIDAVENIEGFFDILSAVHKTMNIPKLQDKYPHLLQRVSVNEVTTKQSIMHFLNNLLYFVSFTDLIAILFEVDFDDLAIRIIYNRYGEALRDFGPATLMNSEPLQHYFYNLKRRLDDNVFDSRKNYLQLLFNSMTFESNKAQNVGKLAIVTWLRVQQHEKSPEIIEIITEMLNKLPHNVDKTLPMIVFRSKLAVAREIEGDSDASDKHLTEAISLSEIYSDPLTRSLLFHDRRYIHQLRFMRSKDEDKRIIVQSVCVDAINFFLEMSQTDFSRSMWRNFSLYLVHNLLKIGQNFEIDTSEEVGADEIIRTNGVLSSLERCFQSGLPLAQRRKMIYYIVRARNYEIQGENDMATSYFSRADSLKDDGSYFKVEERNIDHFRSRLER